jgi:hypothetical protein
MSCQITHTDKDVVDVKPWLNGANAGIIAGADIKVGAAQLAAAAVVAAAQFLAAREQAQLIEAEHTLGRAWVVARQDSFRNMQMGGQETSARTAYSQYIGSLAAIVGSLDYSDFTAYLTLADSHRSTLSSSTSLSSQILDDLFSKALLSQRQGNLATLHLEEQTNFNVSVGEERLAVGRINTANTALARGQEDGVIQAHKEEEKRILKEEGKRGYQNDCLRVKNLSVARLKDQDDIAINNEEKRLENTNRTQELELGISDRNFNLSENNRKARHQLNEADVNQRLENIGTAGEKADGDNTVDDNREVVVNNALTRRYDNAIFKQQRTPPASASVPESTSAAAVGALSAGNLISGAISGRSKVLN